MNQVLVDLEEARGRKIPRLYLFITNIKFEGENIKSYLIDRCFVFKCYLTLSWTFPRILNLNPAIAPDLVNSSVHIIFLLQCKSLDHSKVFNSVQYF